MSFDALREPATRGSERLADAPVPAGPAGIDHELMEWLREFRATHGRPLRVLHVGNIANNAYLNAKFLRSVGIDAHVMTYGSNHVMAMPEWEEIELLHGHGDDFRPRFSKQDVADYQRPDWFIGAPLIACVWKVRALCDQNLTWTHRTAITLIERATALSISIFGPVAGYVLHWAFTGVRPALYKMLMLLHAKGARERPSITKLLRAIQRLVLSQEARRDLARHVESFDLAFPQRPDRLSCDDVFPFYTISKYFRQIFRYYDVVQCYATDPIHALVSGQRPYVAFEHGTLRAYTTGDDPRQRLTALSYRMADHTFITNGDCLAYAERLGIAPYSSVIHPVDVEQHRQDFGGDIRRLRDSFDADVVLYCPLRHDWQIKGTDVHLRALPLIKSRVAGRVKLVLIRWGAQVGDSEKLIASLGCSDDVIWRPSMCRVTMIKHMRAADVVLDQMALPHFGATAPQAMAAGTPVISSYVPESTRWIIPEPAPILAAFSPEEVAQAVTQALEPAWRTEFQRRARRWVDTYHHPNNAIRDHLKVYRTVLNT